MLNKIRKSRYFKGIALYLAFSFIAEIISPSMALALTGGPSQPEVESFSPIGTSEMVDVFSGDFNYNIPLMDVGGYPLNIAYNSGVTMDQEASWVGLGWNLNVGSITRGLRGLPDDFKGDAIHKEFNMKDNTTFGMTTGISTEIFGFDLAALSVGYNFGINYNNYTGVGMEQSVSPTVSLGKQNESGMNLNLGFSIKSNADGLNLSPSVSLSAKEVREKGGVVSSLSGGANVGATFNSRQGLISVNSGLSISKSTKWSEKKVKKDKTKIVKKKSSASRSIGSSVSFTNNTYVPQISMPKHNYSVAMRFTLDGAFFGTDIGLPMSAYYSKSSLKHQEKNVPGYGYVYSQHGAGKSAKQNVLLDFNREKDQPFTQNTPNLPLTNFTYDQFQVSGQGVAGQYRPYRNDVGYVHDNYSYNTSASGDLGVELGPGNIADVGIDVNVSTVDTRTGNWWDDNQIRDNLSFSNTTVNNLFESVHFKQVGELSVDNDPNFTSIIGGTEPVEVNIERFSKFDHRSLNSFSDLNLNQYPLSNQLKRSERVQRNQAMTFLTRSEVEFAGLEGYYSQAAQPHHIGEVSILRPDGARYIYGIPAYNISQRDVTFNASGLTASCSEGVVTYDPNNNDNNAGNQLGIDNFFQADNTPAYSHSFLLTSIVSSDYVDIDGVKGPSEDDLGSYTKFNYDSNPNTTDIEPKVSNYKWRVPYKKHTASYSEGLKADKYDDKGSYTYGEKELWYVHTIETKTHVAEFYISERRDAKGVAGEDGGMEDGPEESSSMFKLDSIELYSLESYKKRDQDPNIFPIKTVHFEYNYDLCPNIENNDEASEVVNGEEINTNYGKLTLRKVYFTYENSRIGTLSPYEFVYGDSDHNGTEESALNKEYNLKGYDRWGNYKNNDAGSCSPTSLNVTAPEFPYVEQNQSQADINMAMWTLTDILMPSGGRISVDYESDDYAYVQDRPAMEMFKVVGLGTDTEYTDNSELYDLVPLPPAASPTETERDYVYIELPPEWTGSNSTHFEKDFTSWIMQSAKGNLYFKFLTNINNGDLYDYVPGYAKILDAGICDGDPSKGYIKVKKVKREAKGPTSSMSSLNVNPFSKAAWQFTQSYLPRVAYNLPDPNQPPGLQLAQAMASTFTPIIEFFRGPNSTLRDKEFARKIVLGKSYIRLQNPTKKKLGGGSRVKQIKIWDNWDSMTNDESGANYGQEYEYTTTLQNGRVISSGVASYEPLLGGDENPFRQPVTFTDEQLMGPKRENYLETPFGESFFPSPSVGYSKVTVRNLVREDGGGNQNVTNHATGKIVHEFYTAKDFPTKVRYTNLTPIKDKTSIIGQVLGAGLRDHMTVSQGYSIELNDMHGKPKANWVYPEGKDSYISGVEYKYNTKTESYDYPLLNDESATVEYQTLDNTVSTINKDGTVKDKEIGVEVDFITDFRESYNYSMTAGAQGNLASFYAGLPLLTPTIFPKFNSTETQFRSSASTKVVNRFGILKETIAHDLGSSVSTNNLAYDAETGDVLLTQTFNEFEDPVYSFSYPAHWAYERMGQAYKNIGATVNFDIASNGSTANSQGILVSGDELLLDNNEVVWVWDDDESSNLVYIIDQFGQTLGPLNDVTAKVIRSGRRNQQQISIGQITSLKNPIVGTAPNKTLVFNGATEILNASSVEYNEKWGSTCDAFQKNGISYEELTYLSPEEVADSCRITDWVSDQLNGLTFSSGNTNAPRNNTSPCYALVDYWSHTGNTYTWDDLQSATVVYPLQNLSQNEILLEAVLNDGTEITLILVGHLGCPELWTCDEVIDFCETPEGEIVNPYVSGLRGNWRALKSWTYLDNRTHSGISNPDPGPDQQYDGIFLGFTPFWETPVAQANSWTKNNTDWTWAAEATEFSPYGNQLENMDALNRYSSEILGYNNTLVKAVSNNSDYNQFAFDGFEDYAFETFQECCPGHFNFHESENWLTEAESHTGRYSMAIPGGEEIIAKRSLRHTEPPVESDDVPYTIKEEDFIGPFGPNTYKGGQNYILSYWVKMNNPNNFALFDYPELEPIVSINYSLNEIHSGYTTKSEIIDGWQHVEVAFSIAANVAGNIAIKFKNNSTIPHFIDDVRIHPFNSQMKSYVYDPVSFRLWAELDERNFATFYEYDENGTLLRIKKETERGIYTIQESRQGSKKEF